MNSPSFRERLALSAGLGPAGVIAGRAGNAIIPNRGVTDPHIHIFNDRAYLFATHDNSIAITNRFCREDCWCWSSDDPVNWKLESVLKPEQTDQSRPFDQCWAPQP